MKRFTRRTGLLAGAAALALSLGSVAVAADEPVNPQVKSNNAKAAAAAVPDACTQMVQASSGSHVLTRNYYKTYTVAANGSGWFVPGCNTVKFTVPRGQQALIKAKVTAELDCDKGTSGWCEGRVVVNGRPALPNNTDRSDTYAWDSSKGGALDWSAHPLSQTYVFTCPSVVGVNTPCSVTAQTQLRFQGGASSLWFDDSTFDVQVTRGPVQVTALPAT